MITSDVFLTTDEVADWLHTSPATLRYWRYRGEGPKSFKAGKRRLYRRADVEQWVEHRVETPGGVR
jgi:excisionase family DNA binding protein